MMLPRRCGYGEGVNDCSGLVEGASVASSQLRFSQPCRSETESFRLVRVQFFIASSADRRAVRREPTQCESCVRNGGSCSSDFCLIFQ